MQYPWLLRIELNGEWEECGFSSRKEALATFAAVTQDYRANVKRAVLLFLLRAANGRAMRQADPPRRFEIN